MDSVTMWDVLASGRLIVNLTDSLHGYRVASQALSIVTKTKFFF